MTHNKKAQSLIFTVDQIMDSGLIFLFIAIGGNLLSGTEMAKVVVAQSIALVCVLFCSCFTTQYLLLRYKNQTHSYWLKLFLFFVVITAAIIVVWFKSPLILSLFFIGIVSEFFKRYCYYTDQSLISGCAMISTATIFIVMMLLAWFKIITFDSTSYVYFYCLAKFLPLLIVIPFFFKSKEKSKAHAVCNNPFKHIIQDSLKLGGVFSIITIIYWVTNQGFFILFKNEIPANELVKLRITQNVFGIVTMLITLYDSIFLKSNINNDEKIFIWKKYFHFIYVAIGLIIVNYLILYLLSITIYIHIDVFEYAFYLAMGQLFYLFSRMPILIMKLRYNLTLILILYLVSLFISLAYLLLNKNNSDFQYIVESIALANFLIFVFSLIIVSKKEKIHG